MKWFKPKWWKTIINTKSGLNIDQTASLAKIYKQPEIVSTGQQAPSLTPDSGTWTNLAQPKAPLRLRLLFAGNG